MLYTYATDDGGALVVVGLGPESGKGTPRPPDGTLSHGSELAVAEWIRDAVAAGITFEVLRSCARVLIANGLKLRTDEPSAEAISDTLTTYLSSIGYLDIRIVEIRQVAGEGWLLEAVADGATVRGRADPSGQLLHVRVD